MVWSRSSRNGLSRFRGKALARNAGPMTFVETLVVAAVMRSLSLKMIGSFEITEASVKAKSWVFGDEDVPFETARPFPPTAGLVSCKKPEGPNVVNVAVNRRTNTS